MPGIERLCWDSCIFYAVLKGEEHEPGELDILRDQVQRYNNGTLEILVSTLVKVEVLEGKLEEAHRPDLKQMMSRSNLLMVDVTPAIAHRAAELRNRYRTNSGHSLSPPDAIHVATAIEMKTELWTLDGTTTKNGAGILKLSSHIESDYGIKVRRPHGQLAMDMGS